MDLGLKQKLGIGFAIVAISVAIVVGYSSLKPEAAGPTSIKKGLKAWVKCGNPDCGNEYQMEKREYWEKVVAVRGPLSTEEVFLECPKCSQKTVFLAEKCPKCGLVFKPNPGIDDYPDRCPGCKYSEMETSGNGLTN